MKQRLDVLMVERGLVDTRNKAAALIMAGEVVVDEHTWTKPGHQFDAAVDIRLKHQMPYVSRAGEKLASVIEPLKLDFAGKTVLDVGSSTGGFTDCALQHGATRVTAVDVGTNQLAYKLRTDQRVELHEQTDVRNFMTDEPVDMAVIDVSFISLTKILEHVATLIKPEGQIVAMVKPQFEAGKALADEHKGLILDEEVRQSILSDFRAWAEDHFVVQAEADSAVHGKQGNRERFFLLTFK
jgi:23S rRNA (cytidine1920-2'-O)/16S rRNA (cytidine1409-2'-O)-methyltransferase